MKLYVIERKLTDGSIARDIVIDQAVLECVTLLDCIAFAEGFAALVEKHTNNNVEIVGPE